MVHRQFAVTLGALILGAIGVGGGAAQDMAAPGIGWEQTAAFLRTDPREHFDFICPPMGGGGPFPVWGTDIYTDNSSICAAAVHAGAITRAGGPVTILELDGLEAYIGTTRNGIVSLSTAAWFFSYSFVDRP